MYLSSRFAACVGIAAFFSAGVFSADLAARPALVGVHPHAPHLPYSGIAPTIVGRHDGYPAAGIRPTIVTPGHRGRGYGYGGYGLGGYDLGYDGVAAGDFGAAGGYSQAPAPLGAPPPFAFPTPPAPCPQIIEVNGGLAHKATTRVVSGSPCRRR